MTTSKPRPAEAAASTRAGETQCCADAKAGKGSPISSTSEPHPAHNWRLTAVTECNWIYESAAERPARASVTVTFQLPGDEGGRDLRETCDDELSNRLDAATREAEGLDELAAFRQASERLAAAMNALSDARAALAESEARLENFAAGGPGAEDFAYSVLLADRDRDRQRLALLQEGLAPMQRAFKRRETLWLSASDRIASENQGCLYVEVDRARTPSITLPPDVVALLNALALAENLRGSAGQMRGAEIRRRIEPSLLPPALPEPPAGKSGLIPPPWMTSTEPPALVG